jgi:hypothetical protein
MIIIGHKTNPQLLGTVDNFECPYCLRHVNWQLLKVEKHFTLFFIPVIPAGNVFSLICEHCNHQETLNKDEFSIYQTKSDLNVLYEDGEINENEWQLKIDEINIEIEKIKEIERGNALRESVKWADLASNKSDAELLKIYFQERSKYNQAMVIAVKNEIEKRNLT